MKVLTYIDFDGHFGLTLKRYIYTGSTRSALYMRMPSSVCRVLVVRASRGNDGCYRGQGSLSLPAHGALWRRDAMRSDGEYSSTLQRGAGWPLPSERRRGDSVSYIGQGGNRTCTYPTRSGKFLVGVLSVFRGSDSGRLLKLL